MVNVIIFDIEYILYFEVMLFVVNDSVIVCIVVYYINVIYIEKNGEVFFFVFCLVDSGNVLCVFLELIVKDMFDFLMGVELDKICFI